VPVENAGSARFRRCAPVRTFIRQRRSGVKSLSPETTDVSEKLLDSGTVLFISQRRKPTKISTEDKSVPAFQPYKNRRSKRLVLKKGASLVVNLERIPKRLPCLIVDSSPEGFRLLGTFRLRRGQVVEIIPDGDPLNVSRCHVIWIGKPGSKQEGQVGLQLLNSTVNPRGA